MRRALLPVLLLIVGAAAVQAEVLMVYSIQRHGARNVLPKDLLLKEPDTAGGPTLLPQGQRQAWDAGAGYAARYLNASTCGATGTCLKGGSTPANTGGQLYGLVGTAPFSNFNTKVRSSALDRTIMTARSFLDAAFPPVPPRATSDSYLPDGQQVVPVYSLPEDGNSLTRAYTACPAYDARLLDWYASDEFAAEEADSAALRGTVASLDPSLDTSLAAWWNVYDAFNVYRTYGVGTPVPDIDNATFSQMQELAYWLEISKMRSSLTGNLLGGALLADLLAAARAAAAAADSNLVSPAYFSLVHLSGHYNSQLGVLGALGLDGHAPAAALPWLSSSIPRLAALLAFELHGDASARPQSLAVRLVLQDGPAANYTTVPLPCASAGDGAEALAGPGACTLEAFEEWVAPRAINSTAAWCAVCENESWTACRLASTQRRLAAADSSGAAGSTGGSSLSNGAWAGILAACATAVAALAGAALVVQRRRWQKRVDEARLAGLHGAGGPLPGTV